MRERFEWKKTGGLSILVPDFFSSLDLSGGFSTRADEEGHSLDLDLRGSAAGPVVLSSRRRIAAAMGIGFDSMVFAEQVHGGVAALVGMDDAGRGATDPADAVPGADALVTGSPGLAVAALSADCPLVLMADEARRAVAVVHSGWRSTASEAISAALDQLFALGVELSDIHAAVGPAIGPCCYEVGRELLSHFPQTLVEAPGIFTERGGCLYLDLAGAIRRQLVDSGVEAERISAAPYCTSCETELFFSYRREGQAAGRCAGVIAAGR